MTWIEDVKAPAPRDAWSELKTQLDLISMNGQQIAFLWDEIRALKAEIKALRDAK